MRITAFRIVLAILSFTWLFVALLPGCNQQENSGGETALRQWFGAEQDSLQQVLRRLDSLVLANAPEPQMQQQFAAARFRYKRIEGVVEYFFQGLTRRINGPALPDVKTEDNQVWPPHGFQVVEEYLYNPLPDSLRGELSNELHLLQTDLNFIAANLNETAILPRHVRELVQHQIIRIATMGITGMDAPVSFLSLPEAAHALEGIRDLLNVYTAGRQDAKGDIEELFKSAIAYARAGVGFDAFDRMSFLRKHLAPLSNALRDMPVPETEEDNLFAKSFSGTLDDLLRGQGFNPDYYTTYASAGSNAAKVALGKHLFFDPRLSRSGNMSCATCHQPEKFFTDGLSKAANLVHGGSLPRNTPTLFYAALQRDQFYDHRSTTLEDQVNDVMLSEAEFNSEAAVVASHLGADTGYRPMFVKAFGHTNISGYELRNAVAAYIRTLSPFASRFDAYLRGDDRALSAQELEGFNLFAGKAKCATCHFIPLFNGTVPPWFTKSESEIIGVPSAPLWEKAKVDSDPGRYKFNQLEELRFAFKTPTVRNSAKTAPYMHNGVYKTLEDVVRFYHKGGGAGIGMDLPFQTLPFDSLQLNKAEEKAIIAFLHSLTDEPDNAARKQL